MKNVNKGVILSWIMVAVSGAVSAIGSQILANYIVDRDCKKELEEVRNEYTATNC